MNTMPMKEFDQFNKPTRSRGAPEVNVESPFKIEEMFFSRTDERGVIEAYNSVFLRVAGYTGPELHGAPHNIIRHKDMPRAAFWLLWDGLQKGHPVAAYVKNKAKDGHYYWVLAIVTPVEGGYLSVRIKPTSPVFEIVQGAYKEILAQEKAEKLTPQESALRLMDMIKGLGFASYGAFQAHALFQEFEARRTAIHRPAHEDLQGTEVIATASADLNKELENLESKFEGAEILTANMKIFAAKLNEGRATINEIAKNYDLMLRDIQNHLKSLVVPTTSSGLWDMPRETRAFFMLCASHLMEELLENFSSEDCLGENVDRGLESEHLQKLCKAYAVKSEEAVAQGVQAAVSIQRKTEFLRRMILGLSTIRIACRVEAGMLKGHAKGLDTIVSRLDAFHDEIEDQLGKIQRNVNAILRSVDDFDHEGEGVLAVE